jgi:hypothetical protein
MVALVIIFITIMMTRVIALLIVSFFEWLGVSSPSYDDLLIGLYSLECEWGLPLLCMPWYILCQCETCKITIYILWDTIIQDILGNMQNQVDLYGILLHSMSGTGKHQMSHLVAFFVFFMLHPVSSKQAIAKGRKEINPICNKVSQDTFPSYPSLSFQISHDACLCA